MDSVGTQNDCTQDTLKNVEEMTIREFAMKYDYSLWIIIRNLEKRKKRKVGPDDVLKKGDYLLIKELVKDIKSAFKRKNKAPILLPKASFRKIKNSRRRSKGVYDKVIKFGGTGKLILAPM